MSFNEQIARQIIVDHYSKPDYKKDLVPISNEIRTVKAISGTCIDNFEIQFKIENNNIRDIWFDGMGCAISTASIDLLCSKLIGKSFEEMKKIIFEYKKMINDKEQIEDYDQNLLEELILFKNVNKQMSRIRCALLGAQTILEQMEKF